MSCPHDIAEREAACADGLCPLCLRLALDQKIDDASDKILAMSDDEIRKLTMAEGVDADAHFQLVADNGRLSVSKAILEHERARLLAIIENMIWSIQIGNVDLAVKQAKDAIKDFT